jgi:ABC-type multidrug transport system fused ATPase/permease subunit
MERDTRAELYASLLGKSMTFHGLRPLGDIMARATNDVREINLGRQPGKRGWPKRWPSFAGASTRLSPSHILIWPSNANGRAGSGKIGNNVHDKPSSRR